MMKHWIKIFQLSRNLGKINFSFLNFRYKFKERLDMYFVVLTCFILSLAGVIYYYYFQIVNQVYIELEVLGINAWFYHLVSCGISIVLTIIVDQYFLFFKRYRKFAIISCGTMRFFCK